MLNRLGITREAGSRKEDRTKQDNKETGQRTGQG